MPRAIPQHRWPASLGVRFLAANNAIEIRGSAARWAQPDSDINQLDFATVQQVNDDTLRNAVIEEANDVIGACYAAKLEAALPPLQEAVEAVVAAQRNWNEELKWMQDHCQKTHKALPGWFGTEQTPEHATSAPFSCETLDPRFSTAKDTAESLDSDSVGESNGTTVSLLEARRKATLMSRWMSHLQQTPVLLSATAVRLSIRMRRCHRNQSSKASRTTSRSVEARRLAMALSRWMIRQAPALRWLPKLQLSAHRSLVVRLRLAPGVSRWRMSRATMHPLRAVVPHPRPLRARRAAAGSTTKRPPMKPGWMERLRQLNLKVKLKEARQQAEQDRPLDEADRFTATNNFEGTWTRRAGRVLASKRNEYYDRARAMHSGMRSRTKRRRDMGREMKIDVSILDFIGLMEEQMGLCFYLHMPMNPHSRSMLMMTVERTNIFEGYVQDNVVLCSHEVNHGCAQWSVPLANSVFSDYQGRRDAVPDGRAGSGLRRGHATAADRG